MAARWLRLVALPPWRGAVFRLWRVPVLAFSVLGAAAVLGFAGGSRPLFVDSAATAALHEDLTTGCGFDVGLTISRQTFPTPSAQSAQSDAGPTLAPATAAVRAALAPIEGLGSLVTTLFVPSATVIAPGPGHRTEGVQLMARTGADRHIDVLRSSGATGAWVSDEVGPRLGLKPGDMITVQASGSTPITVRVRGVYADLRRVRPDAFWCSQERTILEAFPEVPPPTVLLDPADLARAVKGEPATAVDTTWEVAPQPRGWTLRRATRVTDDLATVAADSENASLPLARALGPPRGDSGANADSVDTVTHAQQAAATAAGSIGAAALGTALVALLVLAVAARAWMARRHEEIRILVLRGAGSGMIAVKGVLELGAPMVVGGALGLAAGVAVVRAIGPSAVVGSAAVMSAAALVGGALLASLVVVGVIVAMGTRNLSLSTDGPGAEKPLWPWELLLLTLAGAALYELHTRASAAVQSSSTHIDSLVLLFPVLLIAGGGGLLARLVLRPRRPRRRRGGGHPPVRRPVWAWLSGRRLAAARVRAVPVITAAAMAIGMVVFAASVASTLRASIEAKATLGVGADQAFTLADPHPLPAGSPLRAISTPVYRSTENTVLYQGHPPSDVLGIDPATFARAAYWDPSFSSHSLRWLLSRIEPTSSAPLPVIVVGAGEPARFTLSLQGAGQRTVSVPVRVVAQVRAFPGYQLNDQNPLVVADGPALERRGFHDGPELWVRSNDPEIGRRVVAAGLTVIVDQRASGRLQGSLQPQLWALGYVRVVGLAAGLVALCGLGLFFATAADRRRLGTALAAQMGLRAADRIGATVAEVGAMLVGGAVFGIGLAWSALHLVLVDLDPLPGSPPSVLYRFDWGSAAATIGLALAVTVGVAAVLERPSGRGLSDRLRRGE